MKIKRITSAQHHTRPTGTCLPARRPSKPCACLQRSIAAVALILLSFAATAPGQSSPSAHAPKASPAKKVRPTTPIQFGNRIAKSGIHFTLNNSVSAQKYSIETMAGGVALFDYDNDGLLDIFFTNGASIPSLQKSAPIYDNRLYHNNGDGTFTDVTQQAGVKGIGYSMGVAAADYDNDGFEDLYITGVNTNQLLHNNGNGTFTDVTASSGATGVTTHAGKAWSVAAGWFDYNNDGKLDLLVINYLNYDLHTAALCNVRGLPTYCSPNNFQGTQNILYRNNGDGTFTDVSEPSHLARYIGKGMGLAFADYDGDGFTDVFISNDTFQNFLLHNNRDGTFTDVALQAGVAYNEFGKTVAGMGADFRDLDNDSRPDIFQTAMFGDSFPLYKNLGAGLFEDRTTASGLTAITSRSTAWGAGAFDFDNDGWKDLFTANAAILDNAMAVEYRPYALPNGLFRNKGNLTFEDLTSQPASGLSTPAAHRGAAFGDINNDGRIDAIVSVLNGPPELLINQSSNSNHWLILKLIGTQSNRDGLGTRVSIVTARGSQYNHATTAVGYNSSSDKRIHFGLGDADVIDAIELNWPSGINQTLTHVKADQILTVTEGKP